jgi:hypothetical protein
VHQKQSHLGHIAIESLQNLVDGKRFHGRDGEGRFYAAFRFRYRAVDFRFRFAALAGLLRPRL